MTIDKAGWSLLDRGGRSRPWKRGVSTAARFDQHGPAWILHGFRASYRADEL